MEKIVGLQWRNAITNVLFVAVEYENYWQAYVGAVREHDALPEKRVAEHGAKLSWREAHAFFPDLDIRRYKTFDSTESWEQELRDLILIKHSKNIVVNDRQTINVDYYKWRDGLKAAFTNVGSPLDVLSDLRTLIRKILYEKT